VWLTDVAGVSREQAIDISARRSAPSSDLQSVTPTRPGDDSARPPTVVHDVVSQVSSTSGLMRSCSAVKEATSIGWDRIFDHGDRAAKRSRLTTPNAIDKAVDVAVRGVRRQRADRQ